MTEDLSLDSVATELQGFLESKARNTAYPSRSLIFKIDNKTTLKIVDSDKKSFEVEEFFLQSFRQIFTDKSFKYLKLSNWQFEVELNQRKPTRIVLAAGDITFIANKNTKTQIKQVGFRAIIVAPEQIDNISKEQKGFVRRMIKQHVMKTSENCNTEFYSLLTFVKRTNQLKAEKLTSIAEDELARQHPMDFLNPQGKQVIKKLRGFIRRQDVFDYLVRQELSIETENKLRQIIASTDASTQNKKKKVKAE